MTNLATFARGAQALKLKEVPAYAQKFFGEHYTVAKVQGRLSSWLQNYKKEVGGRAPAGRGGVLGCACERLLACGKISWLWAAEETKRKN